MLSILPLEALEEIDESDTDIDRRSLQCAVRCHGGRHQKGNTKYELLSSKKGDLYGLGPIRAMMGPKDHQDCAFKLSKSSLSLSLRNQRT